MGDGLAKVRITLLKLSINMFLQKSTCLYLVGWIAAWFSFLNYSYNITNQWQLLQNTHDRTKGKGFRHFCRHFFRILKKITLSCRTFNLTNRFQTYSGSTIELQNPQILKKMLQNQVSFVIRVALWTEKLKCCLGYCRAWKNTLGKIAAAVNSIRVFAGSCSELYFACCCALNGTGTFAAESKITRFVSFPTSIRVNNNFETVKVEFVK